MMFGLAQADAEPATLMIDVSYLKAHRTASSLQLKKGGCGRLIGRTKGGLNTERHALIDHNGKPLRFFIGAGQVSDYAEAAAMPSSFPESNFLLADRAEIRPLDSR